MLQSGLSFVKHAHHEAHFPFLIECIFTPGGSQAQYPPGVSKRVSLE